MATRTEGDYQASLADPPPPASDAVWTRRDGTEVRIVDMDDDHLGNTLRMLRRKCLTLGEFAALCRYAATTGGEMAAYAAEREIDRACIMPAIFDDLVAEAARRGLSWEAPR